MEYLARIGKAGADILGREIGIAVKDLLLGPAFGHQIDDKLDSYARALHDRFPDQDLGVYGDAVLPVHTNKNTRQRGRSSQAIDVPWGPSRAGKAAGSRAESQGQRTHRGGHALERGPDLLFPGDFLVLERAMALSPVCQENSGAK